MITINELKDISEKRRVTESVLRDLPEWFGIESSIIEYIKNVADLRFFLARIDGSIAGFLALDPNNKVTAEIHLLGVYKRYHKKGIGKELIKFIRTLLIKESFKFLMVKTLGESHPDKNYAYTREFYNKAGFLPLQEIPEIWGKDNPCLIMLQSLNTWEEVRSYGYIK